ncbi:competence type IV pilus major pilin ComGC [Bacillaceae bacterium S4-13-56]
MKIRNEKGFTLIEMLIVLLIISVLLIITIPNITTNTKVVEDKGCEALIRLAEAQVQAYRMENGGDYPASINVLETDKYISSSECPNGDALELQADGTVTKVAATVGTPE